jgi:hypothetical protein
VETPAVKPKADPLKVEPKVEAQKAKVEPKKETKPIVESKVEVKAATKVEGPKPKAEALKQEPKPQKAKEYTFEELDKLTKRQLLKIAAQSKVVLPNKASKAEMISLLLGE